ncbi:MAG: transposase [Candidatus Brocadiia bacterium]
MRSIMPRANRYMLAGYTYHVTHRCVNSEFLLRYVKDRNAYREWLRLGCERHGVSLFGYCVTSNHVHLIARVDCVESFARTMPVISLRSASLADLNHFAWSDPDTFTCSTSKNCAWQFAILY